MKSLTSPRHRLTLRARLLTLAPNDTPRWGSMSINQMLCHLADANAGAAGARPLANPAHPISLPKEIPNLPKPILTFLALSIPVPWPRNTPTIPSVEQGIGGTPPTTFQADHARLLASFDLIALHSGPWEPHPYFGPLTTSQWMRWAYLHNDHHLRQFGR